jgi:uncharacterized protein involved in exopolysaccharide biosynthesis
MAAISASNVVRKYWRAIVLIGLLSTVLAYASSYLVSPSFSSSARVLLRVRDIRYVSATGQDQSRQQSTVGDSALVKTLAQTTSNLISSQAVANQVVQDLHLDQPRPQDPALFSQIRNAFKQAYKVVLAYVRYGYYAEPPAHEGAVEAVQGAITATQLKDSYTIEIKAMADNPELAASMANSAAKAFIAASQNRTREESEQFRANLKTSVDEALARVTSADEAIRRYSEGNGITDLTEQLRLSANEKSAAQRALADLDAQLKDDQARKDAIDQALANTDTSIASTTTVTSRNTTNSPQTTTGTITVQGDPATSTIATGRSSTTTTNEPGTTTTRNNLTTTQNSNSNSSENHQTTNPNPLYQGLQGSMLQLTTEIAGLEARRTQLLATIEQTNQNASALPQNDATLSRLRLDASTARNAYTGLRASYDAALADASSLTPDGTLIDRATPALYPDKPWRWLFALIGLFIGGLGGLAVGFGVEGLGPRGSYRLPLPTGPTVSPQPVLASQLHTAAPHQERAADILKPAVSESLQVLANELQKLGVAVEVHR